MIRRLRELSTHLWVRLSLAFAGVVLIGVMMTTLIGLLVFSASVEDFDAAQAFSVTGGPVDSVTRYMQDNPQGDGLGLVLAGLQSAYPQDESISITFSYVTANGETIFNGHPDDTTPWPFERFDGQFPVVVDGRAVGYLRIMRMTAFEDWDPEAAFFVWLRDDFGLVVVVGMAIGIIAGIVISRSMTAPLQRLVRAARSLGQRKLHARVEPSGSAEMIQLAKAFNDMADDLEAGETLRRNLVADVAHELRTPLTVLQGNLRAMLDGVYKLEHGEIANLYDQTRVLSRLVTDLHDLAQAEARQLPLNKRSVDLRAMVERLAATFEAVCDSADVTLTANLPDSAMHTYGDPARLAQVINNLLTNALNHTPAGGKITVSLTAGDNWTVIHIRDTGKGISPVHLPHVFERFYRADRARSRQIGGAGLGLAIVRAIVESHDGTVHAESTGIPGQGTVFVVRLPAHVPSALMLPQDMRL
jgi:signal transduction histidine kinase